MDAAREEVLTKQEAAVAALKEEIALAKNALAKAPADRYPSCREFAAALR